MRLYKYCTPERIEVLRSCMIRFTPPQSFNDPFEMLPYLEQLFDEGRLAEVLESSVCDSNFADSVRAAWRKNFLFDAATDEQLNTSAKALFPHLKPIVKSIVSCFADGALPHVQSGMRAGLRNLGILCLSESFDNLLMWGHYTMNHKGIVIEFNPHHSFFHQQRTEEDDLRYLRKVKYSESRPLLTLSDLSFEDMCLTKSLEWKYEQEWRMMVSLADAENVLNINDEDIHLFRVPRQCITGVILGCRVTAEYRKQIVSTLNSHSDYAHVALWEAMLDEHDFSLRFKKVSRYEESEVKELLQKKFPKGTKYSDDLCTFTSAITDSNISLNSIQAIEQLIDSYLPAVSTVEDTGFDTGDDILDEIMRLQYLQTWSPRMSNATRTEVAHDSIQDLVASIRERLEPFNTQEFQRVVLEATGELMSIPIDHVLTDKENQSGLSDVVENEPQKSDSSDTPLDLNTDENEGLGFDLKSHWDFAFQVLYHLIKLPVSDVPGEYFPIPRVLGACPICGGNLQVRVHKFNGVLSTELGIRCANDWFEPHQYNSDEWKSELHEELKEIVDLLCVFRQYKLPCHRQLNEDEQKILDDLLAKAATALNDGDVDTPDSLKKF